MLLLLMMMIKMTVGKWNCVEIFGLWKCLLATLHEVAVRSRVRVSSWEK